MKAFLDTHAAVFLYEGRTEIIGKVAAELMERSALFVSPMVRLELKFLHEMGKISVTADEILGALEADCGLSYSRDAIDQVVAVALALDWTRDPFDRLLVATASLHGAPFLTQDQNIRDHYEAACW